MLVRGFTGFCSKLATMPFFKNKLVPFSEIHYYALDLDIDLQLKYKIRTVRFVLYFFKSLAECDGK